MRVYANDQAEFQKILDRAGVSVIVPNGKKITSVEVDFSQQRVFVSFGMGSCEVKMGLKKSPFLLSVMEEES